MAQVFTCDCCKEVITNPYKLKMKEFYVGMYFDADLGGNVELESMNVKRKVKIHLCDDCWRGLRKIGMDVLKDKMG